MAEWPVILIVERPATDDPSLLEVVTVVDRGATNYRRYRLIEDDPTLPSSVGVTSSDERAADDAAKALSRATLAVTWFVPSSGKVLAELAADGWVLSRLPVPSSDEPEGDERARIVREARARCEGISSHDPDLQFYDAICEVLAARPVPVGDAEPVAPLTLHEIAAVILEDRLRGGDHATNARAVHALLLYRLPVSSQDAGTLRLRQALATSERIRLAEAMDRVNAVLPAEGELRAEMVEIIHSALVKAGSSLYAGDADLAFDALRAAAGKAGSDDAR